MSNRFSSGSAALASFMARGSAIASPQTVATMLDRQAATSLLAFAVSADEVGGAFALHEEWYSLKNFANDLHRYLFPVGIHSPS